MGFAIQKRTIKIWRAASIGIGVVLVVFILLPKGHELLKTDQLDDNELLSERPSEVNHANTSTFKTPESPSHQSLLPSHPPYSSSLPPSNSTALSSSRPPSFHSTARPSLFSPTDTNLNVLNLNEVVMRDQHLCSYDSLESNVTNTEFYKTVKNYLHSLQEFIPDKFLPEYKNPCWYEKRQYLRTLKNKWVYEFSERELDDAYQRFTKVTESDHMYCLPYFFLAGFTKSATTGLYSLIAQHPQITEPVSKEMHFWRDLFEQPGDTRFKQILFECYISHFTPLVDSFQQKGKPGTKANNALHQQITVDASANTIWKYQTAVKMDSEICLIPATVKRTLPEAKFIVIMRDPVKRLFSDYWFFCSISKKWQAIKDPVSHYRHNAKQTFHNITVHAIEMYRECINEGSSRFECVRRVSAGKLESCVPLRLGVGMYYYHIVPWLNVFPRERFLFLKTEELISAPNTELKKVWAFLDLQEDVHINTKIQDTHSNTWIKKYKSSFEMFPETRELLSAFYQPHNQLLAQLLSDTKYLWK